MWRAHSSAVAQAFGIEQAGFVEHHRILERGAERKTGAPEPRHVVHAAEGAGAADFAAEPFGIEIEHVALTADHRIGEIDFDLGAEAGRMGAQFAERIADLDLHRLQHLDEAARRRLCHNTGLIDRGDECRGAAVHDRNFGAIDFDDGVIDAHAAQRSKHMLGGRDQRAVAVAQHGGEFGGDHGFGRRLNFAVGAIQSGADKNKTRIDRCRSKGEIDG